MKTLIILPLIILVFSFAKANSKYPLKHVTKISAQSDSAYLLKIVKAVSRELKVNRIEKAYVQTDKTTYARGDTIWYKAYLTMGPNHKLSTISGVLYCELIGKKDTALQRSILHIQDGVAWGQFALPKHYKEGVYHLRAYTNWMRNASSEYFFDRRIVIGTEKTKPVKNDIYEIPDVQFFPEGGSLIYGVRTKVAFKAVGRNGYGVQLSGIIIDNDGKRVADFKTQHLGMGIFIFIPKKGKHYLAKIITSDGHAFDASLPLINNDGFVLAVNHTAHDSLNVQVTSSAISFNAMKHSAFYLIAQSEGKVYYATMFKLENLKNAAYINTNRFPTGVIQFTLFSANGEPLNERVVFIQNPDSLEIKIPALNQNYKPREEMNINLKVSGPENFVEGGNFSVSVINEGLNFSGNDEQNNLLTSLLLKPEMRGYIEQPGYYFSGKPNAVAGLDMLMLTQGYRKIDWKKIFSSTHINPKYHAEHYLSLEGVLKNADLSPTANGSVELIAADGFTAETTTDNYGNFKIANLPLPESATVSLYGRSQNGAHNNIILVRIPKYPPIDHVIDRKENVNPENISNTMLSDSADRIFDEVQKPDIFKDGMILNDVVITDKAKDESCNCAVYTYQTEADGKRINYPFTGYAIAREFYTPKYDMVKSAKKDQRTTMYWNPQLLTDGDGKASFAFSNSDGKGTYCITIEGLDKKGRIGRKVLYYEVQ